MEAFQKVHPLEFYKKFLERSVRPDGRGLDCFRKINISTGSIMTTDGSSFVKIGNTSVIAGVKAEVALTPTQSDNSISSNNNNNNNKMFVNVEMGPICSNIFSSSKPSEKAMSLCSQLNSLVNRLEINDKELYFDDQGKYSWYLYIDLYCLDYNGNLMDACVLAIMSALKNVKLPKGIVVESSASEAPQLFKDTEQPMRSLNIGTYLIPQTFVLLNDYLLTDPSLEEEKLSSGTISITFNDRFEICTLLYTGITSISEKILEQCLEKTKKRSTEIINLIDNCCTTINNSNNNNNI
ncbi:hypothetical protein DFA_00014 [Cavenderia fasciculata]|uniref:Ribosomal RNA-processing protein 43 n=1 Tax=Cavenderia fasciculata TaxID=261658 RepID=F4PXC7_CACFS|nr:uncharacterized protein DFA_00014 [Cavenderia fasciculata]EGG19437.1 hypothetical protein DFA_00014 [Cavenderia fasciculata]|eukprot:XP_004357731.1 hypothetical protein DFA_00014 [Cavenderia fasciculata]